MQTACNDIMQKKIEMEIESREKDLRETYKDLQKTVLENEFFQSVLDDYEKYYSYIIGEKQKQYDAFQAISEHLDKLNLESSLTQEQTNQLKYDQKEILNRLGFIRRELDEIVRV
jgi:site-specific recombinase XerD